MSQTVSPAPGLAEILRRPVPQGVVSPAPHTVRDACAAAQGEEIMISLARVAARYPRALLKEPDEAPDGFVIFEDAPFEFTAWRRNQPLTTNLKDDHNGHS
jgi:hypothetical protein